ncbi:Tumor necrosis factor receptor superfamily member 10B [Galemys pyrenaicus]|uniref:Tumor necrosis factor receptor superfamily member 10B n=1 Tax=Galemys pyrenaicus TaxID=202257 RepID=A0A8J6ACJ1_GALPY|nr:Tumor necrosis factor receptor superfamily member 10B [Galemys pyrenaicus]
MSCLFAGATGRASALGLQDPQFPRPVGPASSEYSPRFLFREGASGGHEGTGSGGAAAGVFAWSLTAGSCPGMCRRAKLGKEQRDPQGRALAPRYRGGCRRGRSPARPASRDSYVTCHLRAPCAGKPRTPQPARVLAPCAASGGRVASPPQTELLGGEVSTSTLKKSLVMASVSFLRTVSRMQLRRKRDAKIKFVARNRWLEHRCSDWALGHPYPVKEALGETGVEAGSGQKAVVRARFLSPPLLESRDKSRCTTPRSQFAPFPVPVRLVSSAPECPDQLPHCMEQRGGHALAASGVTTARFPARRVAGRARLRLPSPGVLILVVFGVLLLVASSSPVNIKAYRFREQLASPREQNFSPQEIGCPAGYHVSEDGTDCVPCTSGYDFTKYRNTQLSCLRCRTCRSEEEEVSPCTTTTDRVCQCKAGFFTEEDSPEMCQPCTRRCPAGMVVDTPCTNHSDLKCISRESGTWEGRVTAVPGEPLTDSAPPPSPPSGNGSSWITTVITVVSVGALAAGVLLCALIYLYKRCLPHVHTCPQHCLQRGGCAEWALPTAEVDTFSLLGTSVYHKCLHKGFCLGHGKEPGALDNARNNILSNRDSLSSEGCEQDPEGQQQAEPPGVPEQTPREAEPLLAAAETGESRKKRRRLVPVGVEDATYSLTQSFDYFTREVPLPSGNRLMRKLGLKENDIQQARSQAQDPREALYQMLLLWHNVNGREVSVNTLLDALEAIKERLAKEEIEKQLVSAGIYTYEDNDSSLS